VGTYEVCGQFSPRIATGSSVNSALSARFQFIETPNTAQTILQVGKGVQEATLWSINANTQQQGGAPIFLCGAFKFNSVGTKTIRLAYTQGVGGSPASSLIAADRLNERDFHITVKPMINNEQITASFKQYNEVQVPIVTEWVSYTPAISNTTGISSSAFRWRRVGENVEIQGGITYSGAGAGGDLTITIPSGLVPDSSKFRSGSANHVLGYWQWYDDGGSAASRNGSIEVTGSPAFMSFRRSDTSNPLVSSVFAANDRINFFASLPIIGWTATQSIAEQLGL